MYSVLRRSVKCYTSTVRRSSFLDVDKYRGGKASPSLLLLAPLPLRGHEGQPGARPAGSPLSASTLDLHPTVTRTIQSAQPLEDCQPPTSSIAPASPRLARPARHARPNRCPNCIHRRPRPEEDQPEDIQQPQARAPVLGSRDLSRIKSQWRLQARRASLSAHTLLGTLRERAMTSPAFHG